jgi:hypothetical protein
MLNLAALTSDTQPIYDMANALDDGDNSKLFWPRGPKHKLAPW